MSCRKFDIFASSLVYRTIIRVLVLSVELKQRVEKDTAMNSAITNDIEIIVQSRIE